MEENKKKKHTKMNVILLILFLIVACVTSFFVVKYMPGQEMMDLADKYYKIGEHDGAFVIGNSNTDIKMKVEDDALYLPVEAVNSYLNDRFYWDGENILYTLPDETKQYIPDMKYDGYVAVLVEEEQVWVEIRLVEKYTNITWQYFENPSRIWVWNKWDEELTYAQLKYDISVRYRGGPKSPILSKLSTGDTVQVLDSSVKIWTKVQTADGMIGYVWSGALDTAYTDVRKNDFEELEYTNISLEEEIVLMWHQELANSGIAGLPAILETSKINVIAPSWFTIADENGEIVSRANKAYTDMAHEAGVQVWAMLDNINIDIDDDALLSNTESRTNLIENVMEAAIESGVDGINIDLESIDAGSATAYIQLIREFSVACRKEQLILSVDNYVPIGSNLYYNRAEQAQFVDYIIVMGYDEHWAGGEPGSTASYEFVKNGIERSLLEVPKEKLVLAVPFYTRIWTIAGDDVSSRAVGIKHIPDILSQWNVEKEWLEKEQQYYAEFDDGTSIQKIWIEDATSMKWKLDFVQEYQLAGTAIWKANLESSDIWDLNWNTK